MPGKSRTIRASELGAYLYCQRAWWYQLQGLEPENRAELERGAGFHRRHGQRVLAARLAAAAGWVLLLAALALLAAALVSALIG